MKTMTRNIAGADVCSILPSRVQLTSQRATLAFSNVLVHVAVENAAMWTVMWTLIDRGVFGDNENAYFCI